jgi:hypothetical protein
MAPGRARKGDGPAVCTPVDEATLEAAIARVTSALAVASDGAIPELVSERHALREELIELRKRQSVAAPTGDPMRAGTVPPRSVRR